MRLLLASAIVAALGCGGIDETGTMRRSDGGHDAGPPDATLATDTGPMRDGGPADEPDAGPLTFVTGARRGSDSAALSRPSYDYTPSVMYDGVYKMWWCAGVAGDYIMYAEAASLDGPWNVLGTVLGPTGDPASFDGEHTCDPSVIRVDGTYYMYYGGYPGGAGETTRIGVATSPDGRSWTRMNGGNPIVVPARDWRTLPNAYGAGQPTVTHVDGLFYLAFTETTARGANPGNGAGQFVIRSPDPVFHTGVEELTASGFVPRTPAVQGTFSILDAFSTDWQYIDAVDVFAMAFNGGSSDHTHVHLFDADTMREIEGSPIRVPGVWAEGPGIVSRADKHALPGATCGTIPIDLMRAVYTVFGGGIDSWDLAHTGLDADTGLPCDRVPLGRVYEGLLVSTDRAPLTLVRQGVRLQFASLPPAGRLGRGHYGLSSELFHAFPYGASLPVGAPVLGAPGRPPAFQLDDGKLWPVSCLEAITDNGSSITSIDVAEWDAYPKGPSLFCLR